MSGESKAENLMEKIVSLAKRRGFIFPGSEIYGGLAGTWDYGPLGVELKNNIKREFWRTMVYERDDVVGMDAAIMMNPRVWEASGHTEAFSDPLVECKSCHHRFRFDQLESPSLSEIEDNLIKEGTIMVSEVVRSQGKEFERTWKKYFVPGVSPERGTAWLVAGVDTVVVDDEDRSE
ncbi:MAG: hypothetical protein HYT42_00420, partial [Candidatus Sungbacteria bacterium]|nr:hypothetical protein [Candidatus Sungbacteria bacterium]